MPGYSREQIYAAMREADKAGDAAAVKLLSQQLNAPQGGVQYVDAGGSDGLNIVPSDEPAPAGKPTSFGQGLAEGIAPAQRNLGAVVDHLNPFMAAAQWVGGKIGHPVPTSGDVYAANQRAFAASPNQGSTAGKIAGGVAATLPLLALPGGVIGQGAASGALLSEADNPTGFAEDALLGAAFGKGGDVLGKGVGGLIGGRNVSDAARLLHNEGVSLTPGQLGGANSVRQFVEDKVLGSIPGLNAIPDAAATRGTNTLRGAVANRVLRPIGESLPKGTHVDNAAMSHIQQLVYDQYDNAAGALSLQLDPEMATGMADIVKNAPRLVGKEGADQIRANVAHIVDMTHSNTITGQPLKDTLNQIRSVASGSRGELRTQLWNLHDELAHAMERQNPPDLSADFSKARLSVSLLKRMEDAASRAGVTNGEFGPTQLLQAAKKTGFGTTKANVANGQAPFMDIANAAAEVMRNKTANSGTVPRGLAMKALASGGAPIAAMGLSHPIPAALGASQMLGYIPGIAEILQKMSLNRGPALQQAGRAIDRTAPFVGLGAANYGLGLLGTGR